MIEIIDNWRDLLYRLGFLSSIAFSLRMLIQWLSSEKKGKSCVMPIFWQLSLLGNCLLALHSFIQVQFHVCIIQVCNGVISWRNLNLMRHLDDFDGTKNKITKNTVMVILALSILATTTLFALQNHYLLNDSFQWNFNSWFRIPVSSWQIGIWNTSWINSHPIVSFAWHFFGFIGLALFSSRFWIQWWFAEKYHYSYLGASFWWISLIGEVICLIYFVSINDSVNYLGPAFALIPYIRNLMLLNKTPLTEKESQI